MSKKLAETAQIDLDVADAEWDAGHRDRSLEWYMRARTEALVSIALSLAALVEDGGKLDALVDQVHEIANEVQP